MRALFITTLMSIGVIAPGYAGGLLGDALNVVVPGAGTRLDDANRQLKNSNILPGYKQTEEAASAAGRKIGTEITGETAGPALAQWINLSRQNVINSGVRPIPSQIASQLSGFFSDDVINGVRYRSGWGNELALPASAFRFGDAEAITLVDVVMFRNESDAQNDVKTWAHELTHVLQYRQWNVLDFAKRYVKDYRGVEQEAYDNADRFVDWSQQRDRVSALPNSYPAPTSQPVSMPNSGVGNICQTQMGACLLPGSGPLGM